MQNSACSKISCVGVAVEGALYSFDREFSYKVPPELAGKIKPGSRVSVPFGKGNRLRTGIVLSVEECCESAEIKSVAAVLDQAPLLSIELVSLISWLAEHYFCSLYEAAKVMLPAGLRFKMQEYFYPGTTGAEPKTEMERRLTEFLKLHPGLTLEQLAKKTGVEPETILEMAARNVIEKRNEARRRMGDAERKMMEALPFSGKLTEKQEQVYACLQDLGAVSVKELCYYAGVSSSVLELLVRKGAARFFQAPVCRVPYESWDGEPDQSPIDLSEKQQEVYTGILSSVEAEKFSVSLLYGVTGSGKTSVYLKLIDQVLKMGRSVIVLVPEISLTPQTVRIFKQRYGGRTAVLHSRLSMGERLDEWKRIRRREADIVIGTRSAVFAPVSDLGLIVMDEEQEYTYKSESSPRYHARDVAKFRCAYHKAALLLVSATPSLESMYMAQTGQYALYRLENRYGEAHLPKVTVVDMNDERLCGNGSQYSYALREAIGRRLEKGEQSILLLNRRGYHTFAVCTACKEVVRCPHCSISLTYHHVNQRMICHYCGYSVPAVKQCPSCGQEKLSYRGFGTQRAEDELQSLFPQARILRVDTDSAMTKLAFETKMDCFARAEYDILIGTQMVAKGLDFKNVTLVGILSADQSLYSDDFRSAERAFDLFTQVIGRAGRGNLSGEAVIQTFTPESGVIALAQRQDYDGFYQGELAYRKTMLYPPFSDLCLLTFSGEVHDQVRECAEDFLKRLTESAKRDYPELPMRILNPVAATVAKVNNQFRYRLLIKCRNRKQQRQLISGLIKETVRNSRYAGVLLTADINPDMII